MNWFKKILPSRIKTESNSRRTIPEGVWTKCDDCGAVLYREELDKNLEVCPKCNHHMKIGARIRLETFLDEELRKEIGVNIHTTDILKFRDIKRYKDRLSQAKKNTGEDEALIVSSGNLSGLPDGSSAFEFGFMGGSMGAVVGERFVRAVHRAMDESSPLVCFTASGGARMQEGAISLMQLAKTSSKLAQFSEGGGLYIPILTDPTTGGVTASYGMLGDIILAEPGALIGFAGPRVIKQTIGQDLPEGFQRTEFLKEKGFVDHIVTRDKMRATLYSLISMLK